MALISFTCISPVASWAPSVNPKKWGGNIQDKERFQPKSYSDDGTLYSYSRGAVIGRTLEWGALPTADMNSLLVFMGLIHSGATKFTFHDYDAVDYPASRILSYEYVPIKNKSLLYYECTIELQVA